MKKQKTLKEKERLKTKLAKYKEKDKHNKSVMLRPSFYVGALIWTLLCTAIGAGIAAIISTATSVAMASTIIYSSIIAGGFGLCTGGVISTLSMLLSEELTVRKVDKLEEKIARLEKTDKIKLRQEVNAFKIERLVVFELQDNKVEVDKKAKEEKNVLLNKPIKEEVEAPTKTKTDENTLNN